MSVADQVLSLFAAKYGYLKNVDVENVHYYETEMLKMMHEKHPEIVDEINEKHDISNELNAHIKEVLDEFADVFSKLIEG